MGQIQLSENTIHRHTPSHDSHGSRAATIFTTLLTLLILVSLGALVVNYVTSARPQVANSAPASHSVLEVHGTEQGSVHS